MGHKEPVLRPRCIGPRKTRTQILFYSIPFYSILIPRTLLCISRWHNRLHWLREEKNRNFVHVCHSWWHFTGTFNCRHRSFTCLQLSNWWYLKKFVLEFTNVFQLQVLVLLFCTRRLPESTITTLSFRFIKQIPCKRHCEIASWSPIVPLTSLCAVYVISLS